MASVQIRLQHQDTQALHLDVLDQFQPLEALSRRVQHLLPIGRTRQHEDRILSPQAPRRLFRFCVNEFHERVTAAARQAPHIPQVCRGPRCARDWEFLDDEEQYLPQTF